jgi:hypothetical protein
MRKFLPLLLCLLLSIFTVARAKQQGYTPARDTKAAQEESTEEEADAKQLLKDANTDEGVVSDDDDSMDDASGDEGEDMNDDGGGNASGDENAGGDDEGSDDGGDDGGE